MDISEDHSEWSPLLNMYKIIVKADSHASSITQTNLYGRLKIIREAID